VVVIVNLEVPEARRLAATQTLPAAAGKLQTVQRMEAPVEREEEVKVAPGVRVSTMRPGRVPILVQRRAEAEAEVIRAEVWATEPVEAEAVMRQNLLPRLPSHLAQLSRLLLVQEVLVTQVFPRREARVRPVA
jgi:hypothetical protein